MSKTLIISVLLVLYFNILPALSQQTAIAAADNSFGSDGSLNYSVGQVLYTSHAGTSVTVQEGIQQSYEISVIEAIEKENGININITAYPDPVSDILTLIVDQSEKLNIRSLRYSLCDINGKVLKESKIEASQVDMDITRLSPSIYVLKVFKKRKEIKSFQVVKN